MLDASLAFFESRLARQPDDIVSPAELANRYLARFATGHDIEDVWRAERALARGLAAHPGYAAFLARQVPIHIARHEFPEALEAARAAYALAPRQSLNGLLFDAYFETGQYDSALAALNRMDPAAFGYLIRKARYAGAVGRPVVAERALRRACRAEGLTDDALRAWCAVRVAEAVAALADPRGELRVLRKALRGRPEDAALLFALAQAELRRGAHGEAERLFARVARLPGGGEADLWLVRLADQRGDSAGAAAHRARFAAVATDPRYGRAYWAHLATMYADLGRFDQALTLAHRDLAQRPGPETLHTLATVLSRAKRPAEARQAVERALAWTPGDPRLLALRDSLARSY